MKCIMTEMSLWGGVLGDPGWDRRPGNDGNILSPVGLSPRSHALRSRARERQQAQQANPARPTAPPNLSHCQPHLHRLDLLLHALHRLAKHPGRLIPSSSDQANGQTSWFPRRLAMGRH